MNEKCRRKTVSLGKHLFNKEAEFCSTGKQKKKGTYLKETENKTKLGTYWNQTESNDEI